ncbi:MAG: TrmH family RNA methyltransferase, partial [Candidatus Cloacimonetes bacterium]|nr:TrmH family RNA methyltransferase [Candidatus Cloacimonadota bacterium]
MSFSPTKLQKLSSEHKIKLLTKLLARLESSLGSEQGIEEIVQDLSTIAQSMDGIGDPALRQCLEKVLAASDSYVILEALSSYHGLSPRKDGQIHIRKLDGSPTPDPLRLHKAGQVVLILDNLRSVFNVGSIFRTAECLGISKIILCGITPSPHHPNMDKTAMGTHKLVAWESYPDTSKVLKNLHHQGYASYALET